MTLIVISSNVSNDGYEEVPSFIRVGIQTAEILMLNAVKM